MQECKLDRRRALVSRLHERISEKKACVPQRKTKNVRRVKQQLIKFGKELENIVNTSIPTPIETMVVAPIRGNKPFSALCTTNFTYTSDISSIQLCRASEDILNL